MKYPLVVLLTVAILGLSIGGCSVGSDSLQGTTWTGTVALSSVSVSFEDGGRFTSSGFGSGTYSLNGDQVKLSPSGDSPVRVFVLDKDLMYGVVDGFNVVLTNQSSSSTKVTLSEDILGALTDNTAEPASKTLITEINLVVAEIENSDWDDLLVGDSIVLVHADPALSYLSILRLPFNLEAEVPGHGTQTLAYAYTEGGIDLLLPTIQKLLGFDLTHYMETDPTYFARFVGWIDGTDDQGKTAELIQALSENCRTVLSFDDQLKLLEFTRSAHTSGRYHSASITGVSKAVGGLVHIVPATGELQSAATALLNPTD